VTENRGLKDVPGGFPNEYEADRRNWDGVVGCCLAHRKEVFWHPQFGEWVHGTCFPCDGLAGETDPDERHCRYCGVKVIPDGAWRLWEFTPDSAGEWVTGWNDRPQWKDNSGKTTVGPALARHPPRTIMKISSSSLTPVKPTY
jgi:hypothetical protein